MKCFVIYLDIPFNNRNKTLGESTNHSACLFEWKSRYLAKVKFGSHKINSNSFLTYELSSQGFTDARDS